MTWVYHRTGLLKAELQRNNVPYNASSKKSKLIQLCKETGLIDGRVVLLQNNSAVQQTHSGSQPPDNNLLELAKSVTELQKTVRDLTESVSQLKRNEQGSVYPSQGNFSTIDQVQTNNTSQTRMAVALEGIGLWQSQDLHRHRRIPVLRVLLLLHQIQEHHKEVKY